MLYKQRVARTALVYKSNQWEKVPYGFLEARTLAQLLLKPKKFHTPHPHTDVAGTSNRPTEYVDKLLCGASHRTVLIARGCVPSRSLPGDLSFIDITGPLSNNNDFVTHDILPEIDDFSVSNLDDHGEPLLSSPG